MRFLRLKWIVPIILLAAFYIGDQIRLARPDHKYRLTLAIETPFGLREASGLLSVRPNRGYGGSGSGPSGPQTSGEAVVVGLPDNRAVAALLVSAKDQDFQEPGVLPLRALAATGARLQFRDLKTMAGAQAAVPPGNRPLLLLLRAADDPTSAVRIDSEDGARELGEGYRIAGLSVAIVPAGWWPLDFGGVLGEPISRGVGTRLPWLHDVNGAAKALQAAGVAVPEGFSAEAAFSRK